MERSPATPLAPPLHLPVRLRSDIRMKPLPPPPPPSKSPADEELRELKEEAVEEEEAEEQTPALHEMQRMGGPTAEASGVRSAPLLSPASSLDPPSPKSTPTIEEPRAVRPLAARRATAPEASSPTLPTSKFATLTVEPRSRSPFARPHYRSHSSTASGVLSPGFARSKSLPYVDAMRPASPLNRPASPFSSAGRRVSPLRRPFEDSYSFSGVDIDQTIAENSELELDLKPRPVLSFESIDGGSTPTTPSSPLMPYGTFPRTRRRPSSPLHVHLSSPSYARSLHASASSPTLRSPASSPVDPAKYNEAFPGHVVGGGGGAQPPVGVPNPHPSAHYATSIVSGTSAGSMPSTPSSFRSRSPSISSLETIPDSPDAEAAAAAQVEHDRDALARLRAMAEKDKREDAQPRTRGRTMGRTSDSASGASPASLGLSVPEKRKRWSVCGAERRGDLEMETIWED